MSLLICLFACLSVLHNGHFFLSFHTRFPIFVFFLYFTYFFLYCSSSFWSFSFLVLFHSIIFLYVPQSFLLKIFFLRMFFLYRLIYRSSPLALHLCLLRDISCIFKPLIYISLYSIPLSLSSVSPSFPITPLPDSPHIKILFLYI